MTDPVPTSKSTSPKLFPPLQQPTGTPTSTSTSTGTLDPHESQVGDEPPGGSDDPGNDEQLS